MRQQRTLARCPKAGVKPCLRLGAIGPRRSLGNARRSDMRREALRGDASALGAEVIRNIRIPKADSLAASSAPSLARP